MRTPIVAGNWKMNMLLPEDAILLATLLAARLKGDVCERVEVVICPPFTLLHDVRNGLRSSRIKLGAQHVFWESKGAFTGEISPAMLRGVFCHYVIIGHSERRTYFGETDETVQRRTRAALAEGLLPIVCIGETLAQRDANQTHDVLARQLDGALSGFSAAEASRLVLAYEPVWAIGTGRNATPEQAQDAHETIRRWVATQWGESTGASMRIQYGGSVTAANAASLLQQPDVDGALVGGASLDGEAFSVIVRAALYKTTLAR